MHSEKESEVYTPPLLESLMIRYATTFSLQLEQHLPSSLIGHGLHPHSFLFNSLAANAASKWREVYFHFIHNFL